MTAVMTVVMTAVMMVVLKDETMVAMMVVPSVIEPKKIMYISTTSQYIQ